MPIRKFKVEYTKEGVQTTEIPMTPKLPPPVKQKGPDRTYQVALRAIKEGIQDRAVIAEMIKNIYGAEKSPQYIAKSIARAWSMINDKQFREKHK